MEKNVVVLELAKYQELIDFKREIESGKVIKIYYDNRYNPHQYLNIDDVVSEITDINNELMNTNKILRRKLDEYNEDLSKTNIKHLVELDRLKKMTIWGFIKWRKS